MYYNEIGYSFHSNSISVKFESNWAKIVFGMEKKIQKTWTIAQTYKLWPNLK